MTNSNQLKISPKELGSKLNDLIKTYTDEVVSAMPEIVEGVAKDTAKDLSSRASRLFKGTKYNKSFKVNKGAAIFGQTSCTVYSTEYRLAHLLEHGHKIKNKTGVVYGMTQAKPHWQPAEEAAVDSLEEKLTQGIEGK